MEEKSEKKDSVELVVEKTENLEQKTESEIDELKEPESDVKEEGKQEEDQEEEHEKAVFGFDFGSTKVIVKAVLSFSEPLVLDCSCVPKQQRTVSCSNSQ
jgi:activator of 2-hydroxyglutaryl-CoA dehydratase